VGRDGVEEHAQLRSVPDLVALDDGVRLGVLGPLRDGSASASGFMSSGHDRSGLRHPWSRWGVLLPAPAAHTEVSGGGRHDHMAARAVGDHRGGRLGVAFRTPQPPDPWPKRLGRGHNGSCRASSHP